MDPFTRSQLLAISERFYREHGRAFDASRGHRAWPGWERIVPFLPGREAGHESTIRVLDVGCGNARLARFFDEAGLSIEYTGLDASEDLLAAAAERLPKALLERCRLVHHDFLRTASPGSGLPPGPFDLAALMGVLHHVPGRDWRLALLRAVADRLAPGGLLALATWQFAGRPRFANHEVDWSAPGDVCGAPVDTSKLEAGDRLLRFGEDPPDAPRYCHQVEPSEFESWPDALGLEALADYRADGAEGDLNHYWLLRRAAAPTVSP